MRLCFSVCNRRFLTGVIMFMLLYPMSVFAVQGQIAVQGKAMSIKQAIQVIEKNSKYTFFYKAADLSNAKIRDIHCEGSIEEVLNVLFKDSGISYVIKDNEVILKSTPVVVATPQQSNKIVVKGNIRDTLGESVIGATIMERYKWRFLLVGKSGCCYCYLLHWLCNARIESHSGGPSESSTEG